MKKRFRKTIKNEQTVFPVILQEEAGGGFVVANPAFEGCYSQGDTMEEALANIREATELCLEEAREENRQPVPRAVSVHLIHA
ncbi:MAG: hypothetical protein COV91_02575 [Candidatus Taylorbacteria bacterium CG11_big_fil_rev_8_21_14_0_20_46_11]|uniref:HicB-like antitoxin of toxin-antitoxin system domain-containing protein n=1 Tax=Candidatus Taylorbacteria bacterium CG11_big_fil_rev_8_21_14_0_20_46_11 TaxID=1975025 RepID=A0A2H0KBV3_9BACT|nr:MAG: hypothetical protein COV91_02575 [Candidatus Taylorbacteria bacterium CG11_big_fil_rev_8_21_14_0_20_46_11]